MRFQPDRLLVRPAPIAGPCGSESLTSWIFRLASANGFATYGELMHDANIVLSASTLIDLEPERWALLAQLQQLSGVCVPLLQKHTLNAALVAMTGSPCSTAGRWLMPSSGRGCRFAVCPACLAEDSRPYWRSAWRLSVSTICPVHRHLLVDTCSGCAGPLVLTGTRMASLRHCEQCGQALHVKVTPQVAPRVSKWRMVPAHELRRACLPVSVAHSKLWWDGVRVLLNVLSRAQFARKLQQSGLPRRFAPVLACLTAGQRMPFDHRPLETRHRMLDLIDWLTKEWPSRFVRCMNNARITHSEFSTSEIEMPYWLWSVCKRHLEKKHYWPSVTEVAGAVALLKSTNRQVSKHAVKRLLGVTQGKALNVIGAPILRCLSSAELLAVAQLLNADLSVTSTAREARASLLRDACSIAAAAWMGVPLKAVARLSIDDGEALLQQWHAAACMEGVRSELAQFYLVWMERYLCRTRSRFERYDLPQQALFLTRYGVPSQGFGLVPRFADLLRRARINEWPLGSRLLTAKPKD